MESWSNGPHTLEFEPPDIFHWHIRAPLEAHEAEETFRILREEIRDKRGIRPYLIAYIELSGSVLTPGARKAILHSELDTKASIVVGGGPVFQAAVNLMGRSLLLLWRKPPVFRLVKTVEEARQCLAEFRAKDESKLKPSG